jgi:tetratricopeptide (TPR) repeat protein
VLYEMDGRIQKSKTHYERAIELDSSLAESKNNLAYLLAEEGEDLERALDLAQEAKGLLPDSPNTADTLGWVLLKRGVPAAAIGYLREAVAGMDPENPAINVIRQHLAEAYEANNEPDRAVETLEQALRSLEQSTEAALTQGKQTTEPKWAAEARETIARLTDAEVAG